jgi:hypothetical protein
MPHAFCKSLGLAAGMLALSSLAVPRTVQSAPTPAEVAELAADRASRSAVAVVQPERGTGGGFCPVGTVESVFSLSNFEADDGGWIESGFGDWERGPVVPGVFEGCDTSPTAEPTNPPPSGANVFGTNLNGCYANSNADNVLSRTFDFSTLASPIQLRWWHWFHIFETFDSGIVRVNGTQVFRSPNATATSAYTQQIVDISSVAGNGSVPITFTLHATTVVNRAGWYLDDIEVVACDAVPVELLDASVE